MRNVVHIPCDCEECGKNQTRLEIFKKVTPFLERKIAELKIKNEVGMAGSTDKTEYDQLKEIFPNTLGDKNV